MIFRWVIKSLILYAGKAFVWCFAWMIAMFVYRAEESDVTGFPSMLPGEPREFIAWPFKWAQTHDAPVDEYRLAGYYKGKWTERFKDNRWLMRVAWLMRNPAYNLAERLGEHQGYVLERKDSRKLWRSDRTGFEHHTAINGDGKRLFLLQGQWLYSKRRKLEVRLGYGIWRESPKRGRAMLYARVLPAKKR